MGDLVTDSYLDTSLEHLRCFYPGSIALGVMAGAVTGPKAARYLQFAANMTTACFQLYNQTASGARPRVGLGRGAALLAALPWRQAWRRGAAAHSAPCRLAALVCSWRGQPWLAQLQPPHFTLPAHPAGLGAEKIDFDGWTGEVTLLDTRYWQRPEVGRE